MTTKQRIIQLTGYKGSGKDTFANYVIKKYPGLHPIKLAYADPLKDIAFELIKAFYGPNVSFTSDIDKRNDNTNKDGAVETVKREDFDDSNKKERAIHGSKFWGYTSQERDLTIRELCQYLGTEIFRDRIDENLWVKLMITRIQRTISQNPNCQLIMISDYRYPNELEYLRENIPDNKWMIHSLRIERKQLPSGQYNHHRSEMSINNLLVDMIIENNGSLEDFYRNIDEYLRNIL